MARPVTRAQLETFLRGFYRRHVALSRFRPKVYAKTVLDPRAHHPEASQVGDDVWLYPKFFTLTTPEKDHIFAHELGHWVSTQVGLVTLVKLATDDGIDVWNRNALPYGQFNMEEAFAEVFASVHLDTTATRRAYPKWSKLVDQMIDALP